MLKLEKMDRRSFQTYRNEALSRVVNDYAGSGFYSKEEAVHMAQDLFEEMLPEGASTPGQFLLNIVSDKGDAIGIIWYGAMKKDYGYVNDFYIYEPYRNKGYEAEALKLLEEDARSKGLKSLDLHAFTNTDKLSLFESMGYRPYYVRLAKLLS